MLANSSLRENGTLALWNYEASAGHRYSDILYYSLKRAFLNVYHYPGVFVASNRAMNATRYAPTSPYEVNTIDRNTLTKAFLDNS